MDELIVEALKEIEKGMAGDEPEVEQEDHDLVDALDSEAFMSPFYLP